MKYNFDKKIDRCCTCATKWQVLEDRHLEHDVIPMWVADMDFEVPALVINNLKKRLECPVFGYTVPKNNLKELFCKWYEERYAYKIAEEDTVFVTGVMQTVSQAIRLFSNEGDKIILPTPLYHQFEVKTLSNKRVPLYSKMIFDGQRYRIDFETLEKEMDEKCKIFILCNPHNPTGALYTVEEIDEIAKFCEKHNLKIISDEIHIDFVFNDKKIVPIINHNDYTKNNTIVALSVSKTFNVAGAKISMAVIKNAELRAQFEEEAKNVGVTSINLFAYAIFEACYEEGRDWIDQLLPYLDENRKYTYDFIDEHLSEFKTCVAESTYFIWLDMTKLGLTATQLEKVMVDEARVMPSMGSEFGAEYDTHIRLNLGCPKESVIKALNNIKVVVDKYRNY